MARGGDEPKRLAEESSLKLSNCDRELPELDRLKEDMV